MNSSFRNYLLEITNSTSCAKIEVIQSLWSGYGEIARYQLKGAGLNSVVVKQIVLDKAGEHPRGWDTDLSHQRKVKSYEVENYWYNYWSSKCNNECKIPLYLGSFSESDKHWIVLEDLDEKFPVRKQNVNLAEIKVCLRWLAVFHANFLEQNPEGLWEIGNYWHLSTRPDEWDRLEHKELKAKARLIDQKLNQCKYQTIVHGDAKLANFCFSEDGNEVAAVDFQYVGGGCGMKDVAYFLGSCLSSSELGMFDEHLLDSYFSELREALRAKRTTQNLDELEREWRAMYPLACADFTRFLLGWMPEHRKVNEYNLKMVELALRRS